MSTKVKPFKLTLTFDSEVIEEIDLNGSGEQNQTDPPDSLTPEDP